MRQFSEGFWIFVVCVVAFLVFMGGIMAAAILTS